MFNPRVPILPGAAIAPEIHNPAELKLADITMEEAGRKRGELIRKWREKIGK